MRRLLPGNQCYRKRIMIIRKEQKNIGVSAVGGKGNGLFKLLQYGFPVPDFFVIAAGTNVEGQAFGKDLSACAQELCCELFSVRSSGVSEDGASASFAGQYLTELNVPACGLQSAVRRVCASARGESVSAYFKRLGALPRDMAVVVQRQIAGVESGVLFSTAPNNAGAVLIERVSGGGDGLVSGMKIPQTLYFRKGEREEGYLGELLCAAQELEEKEGCPVDVEWTYDGKRLWFLQLRRQTALSDELPPLPCRNWNLYVYRDFTVFSHSVQALASGEEIQERLFGFFVPIREGLLVCGREFYSDENDAAANKQWESLDHGCFFDEFSAKIEAIVRKTRRRTATVQKKDFSALSDKHLFAAYRRELAAYLESYVPMMMRPDDYLYGKLVDCSGKARAEVIVNAVKSLLPPTDYSRERVCFLRAVASGESRAYLEKYEWKNSPLGKVSQPVTEEELRQRAVGLSADAAREILKNEERKNRMERAVARKIFSHTEGEERRLAELILRFTYFRTRTAESSDRYFYYIRKNLLSVICRRARITGEELLLYRVDEISTLISGKRLKRTELIKRKSGEAIFFFDGGFRTHFGAGAYGLLKRLLPAPEVAEAVFGEIACAGEAEGTVKVVSRFSDAVNMEKGQILVASMTTPDLTLALEKAAGIITDEGGITCHAAILAREYAVPCLVGTKIATQVLRDGMRVKLDCVNGCFRIV